MTSASQGREKAREAVLASPELRGALEIATFERLPVLAARVQSRAA